MKELLHSVDSVCCLLPRGQELPVALTGGVPAVRWLGVSEQGKQLKPDTLSGQQYKHLLPLFFQGVPKRSCCSWQLMANPKTSTYNPQLVPRQQQPFLLARHHACASDLQKIVALVGQGVLLCLSLMLVARS